MLKHLHISNIEFIFVPTFKIKNHLNLILLLKMDLNQHLGLQRKEQQSLYTNVQSAIKLNNQKYNNMEKYKYWVLEIPKSSFEMELNNLGRDGWKAVLFEKTDRGGYRVTFEKKYID